MLARQYDVGWTDWIQNPELRPRQRVLGLSDKPRLKMFPFMCLDDLSDLNLNRSGVRTEQQKTGFD